ncbi:S8/S53 family peptidase [Aspergillus affinis]|uniref:S8/S53 family peptidase n=1 Tax=Aspergillus affinis TaxID=1070780 RepID=UPI0022FE30D3|nr:uncharacterized protein KD926_004715 [Aspergillus affinis]KAI9042925.1 hypothetical protein KD926_004715 [Aspergillus affinis]
MATEDPIDFAHTAILQVAHIASSLGVELKRPVCARLGAELLLVADYIDTAGLDQENRLRLRISKLLRDVETICNWPHQIRKNGYPLLEAIGESLQGMNSYERAHHKIRRGLDNLTKDSRNTEGVITHIAKFTKRDRKASRRDVSDDTAPTKQTAQPQCSKHANELVHRALKEVMCCTCQIDGPGESTPRGHLVCLLLQPPSQQGTGQDLVQFDMLFSSTPLWQGLRLSRWQEVGLLVPRSSYTSTRKRARFADADDTPQNTPSLLSSRRFSRVDRGQFCRLIGVEADSRLCLSVQNEELQHCFEPPRQNVKHVPGIPLATILRNHHLPPRMKVVLAYIIAYSVWQYYDSDWMKTEWTSETIQFMQEARAPGDVEKVYTWKPYLSVHFNGDDPECNEFNKTLGVVHYYPRIRALGIMLVEIGIGFPLFKENNQDQPLAARINKELLTALDYTRDRARWRDFDYPGYMSAISHCLEPDTFNIAPFVEGASSREWKEGLKQRRNILYDKVVFPLEELLQGTKWMNDYTKIDPLDLTRQNTKFEQAGMPEDTEERKVSKKKRIPTEKAAARWLSRLEDFHKELAQVTSKVGLRNPERRVRIAILDTGYDEGAPFFFLPGIQSRLKGWKDWVDRSDTPQDCDGHGTHLVSLIMKCAPEADLYVARIAKDARNFSDSSEHIANAISLASDDWKADIISMSFGFADEQPCISEAIHKALYQRHHSILFFAAAANFGGNSREMFPARHDSVISIRATNANGDFEDSNPPKSEDEANVFGTLGVDVPSAWPDRADEVCKSGSSISTAIAAGIAGFLLEYIGSHPPDKPFYAVQRRAWTRKGMHAIFKALASDTLRVKTGYLYLKVWDLIGQSEDSRWAKLGTALSDL